VVSHFGQICGLKVGGRDKYNVDLVIELTRAVYETAHGSLFKLFKRFFTQYSGNSALSPVFFTVHRDISLRSG